MELIAKLLFLFFFTVAASHSHDHHGEAATPQPKICAKPEAFSGNQVDLERYSGRWFVSSQIPSWFSPKGTKCNSANYKDMGNGTLSVRNTQLINGDVYQEICGSARPELINWPGDPGAFLVNLSIFGDGDYWLLDTDYESYASVYSCLIGQPEVAPLAYGWVLTREVSPSAGVVEKGLAAFKKRGIATEGFIKTPQGEEGGCSYDPPEGSPNCSGGN